VDDSVFFARLFSITCTVLSIFVFYLIAKKHVRDYNPVFVSALFAFNPFVVWAALEIRVYAMVLLCSTLIIYLFLETYVEGDVQHNKRKRVLYSIIAVFSVYTQYYLVFLLIANFLFLLILNRWDFVRKYLIDMILPLVSVAYFLLYINQQIAAQQAVEVDSGSLVENVFYIIQLAENLIVPIFSKLHPESLRRMSLVVFVVLISVSVYKNLKLIIDFILKERNYFVLVSILLFSMYLFLIIFLVDKSNLRGRHVLTVLIPLLFSIVLLFRFTNPKRLKYYWLSVIFFSYVVLVFINYYGASKGKSYKDSSVYIEKNEVENEPLVFFAGDLHLIYLNLYSGPNKIIAMPSVRNFDSLYNKAPVPVKSFAELDEFIKRENLDNRFWYISSKIDTRMNNAYLKYYPLSFNYSLVDQYLDKYFDIESEVEFPPHVVVKKMKKKKEVLE
jgi:uncharacterized membrane protein